MFSLLYWITVSTLLDYCPLVKSHTENIGECSVYFTGFLSSKHHHYHVKSDTENIGAATLEQRPGLGRPAGTFRLDPPSRLPRALGSPEQNCMHACTQRAYTCTQRIQACEHAHLSTHVCMHTHTRMNPSPHKHRLSSFTHLFNRFVHLLSRQRASLTATPPAPLPTWCSIICTGIVLICDISVQNLTHVHTNTQTHKHIHAYVHT